MTQTTLPSSIDTVIVGAGQAGLTASRLLADAGQEHVILERRDRPGGGWQDRWDSFCLVTPNWMTRLPGFAYDGQDPDGFMPRDEVIATLARFGESFGAPVAYETEARGLSRVGEDFELDTTRGAVRARRVVVAAGGFQRPNVPAMSAAFPARVTQVHSNEYRNEAALPPGGVLVVGSGQSGSQIAEELLEAGREVFLSVGKSGAFPRRYRGRDFFWWVVQAAMRAEELGLHMRTVADLPSQRARFAGNPTMSGRDGGHDLDARRLGARGVTLLGHIDAVGGEHVTFAPDLAANLALSDRFFDERLRPDVEQFIERAGIDAPPDDREAPPRFDPMELPSLDLHAAGISTVIWASGYRLDFSWIHVPIFDDMGYPRHARGVSEAPGLYFLGLPWLHTQASPTFAGVSMDAAHLVSQMGIAVAA